LYCAGVGKSTIAVRMRETGEPELAKCSGPTVEGWLRNKTVLGYWNDIPDAYPAIIDPVLFLRAQQRSVEARTTRPAKTAKHFLVGLVKCGHCGGNYIMQNKDGSPHSMRCLNRQRLKDSGCSNTRTIPKAVLDYIRSTTSTPAIRAAMKRQQLTANESRILAIQNELEGLSKQIQRLATILATMDDVPEIQAQLVERHAQRKMLEQEKLLLERSEPEDPARMLWKDAVAQLKEEAPEREALEADKIKLNALLRSVGYKIVVHDDGGIMVGGSGYKYIGYHREGSTFKLIHQGVTRYINKGGVEVQQAMLVPVGAVDVKVGDIPRITDVAKYIKPITIKRG